MITQSDDSEAPVRIGAIACACEWRTALTLPAPASGHAGAPTSVACTPRSHGSFSAGRTASSTARALTGLASAIRHGGVRVQYLIKVQRRITGDMLGKSANEDAAVAAVGLFRNILRMWYWNRQLARPAKERSRWAPLRRCTVRRTHSHVCMSSSSCLRLRVSWKTHSCASRRRPFSARRPSSKLRPAILPSAFPGMLCRIRPTSRNSSVSYAPGR